MAEKKSIVTVIDGIEENKGVNNRGWAKYLVYLEGEEGVQKLDIPKDILEAGFDLEEGQNVTLNKGPFSWILSDRSECISGEAPNEKPAPTSKRGKPQKDTPQKGGGYNSGSSSGRPFSDWDLYQIEKRDPQMRMQTLLGITRDVYFKAIEESIDPEELLNNIISGAQLLDKAVQDYVGIE